MKFSFGFLSQIVGLALITAGLSIENSSSLGIGIFALVAAPIYLVARTE